MEVPGATLREDAEEQGMLRRPRGGLDQDIKPIGSPSGSFCGYEHSRRSLPGQRHAMAHEIAKLLLEKAGTFLQRTEAVKVALQMGMPLNEIQDYLDWLDSIRPMRPDLPNPLDLDEESQG